MKRTENCLGKLARMDAALHHREADRVPVSDFFWGGFLERWRRELGLAADADIYRYYDLDWTVTIPNMDPHIQSFEIVRETAGRGVRPNRLRGGHPQEVRGPDAGLPFLRRLILWRRWRPSGSTTPGTSGASSSAGDNQIAGVGDGFARNSPAWTETVRSLHPDFPVFGSICEGHEQLWRIIGTENVMLWIGLYPEELGRFIERVGTFVIELTKAQIKAADGLLDGMVIWGDVAYVNGMLFSPVFWREHFRPIVAEQIRICHDAGLPVIYHGCGNASPIYEDFIALGLDSYNPLEAKSGLNVVDLRRRYGHRMGFCGNMDALAWANAPMEEIRRQAMTKLNAARGGGYIFQSDHSVPSNVSAERYEYVVNLVRKHGRYPLSLGEYDFRTWGARRDITGAGPDRVRPSGAGPCPRLVRGIAGLLDSGKATPGSGRRGAEPTARRRFPPGCRALCGSGSRLFHRGPPGRAHSASSGRGSDTVSRSPIRWPTPPASETSRSTRGRTRLDGREPRDGGRGKALGVPVCDPGRRLVAFLARCHRLCRNGPALLPDVRPSRRPPSFFSRRSPISTKP